MEALSVTTWNVLHRIHAVNWGEPPSALFPDEKVRIARIVAVIESWLTASSVPTAICLQEVSGDLLAALRSMGERRSVTVFAHLYPRIPRLRHASSKSPPLEDVREYLVTVVTASNPRCVEAVTFDTDPGKGLLAVAIDDHMLVVNTHVTYGPRKGAQLERLTAVIGRWPGPAVMVGDYNAPADVVRSSLVVAGRSLAISDLTGQRPTRVPGGDAKGSTIDHIIVFGGEATPRLDGATVLDGGGLSDHEPVRATYLIEGW